MLVEQGYPLEMRTAEVFRAVGFAVSQAEYYLTSDGKAREIDVVATLRTTFEATKLKLRTTFVVECKRSQKPWVLLSTPLAQEASYSAFYSHADERGRILLSNIASFADLPSDGILKGPARSSYALTVAHRKDNGERDFAYSACQSVLNAVEGRKDALDVLGDNPLASGIERSSWTFPLIVIEGRLVQAHLDQDGELQLSETDRGRLQWAGHSGPLSPTVIDIVTIDGLASLLATFKKELDVIEIALSTRPELASQRGVAVLEWITSKMQNPDEPPS